MRKLNFEKKWNKDNKDKRIEFKFSLYKLLCQVCNVIVHQGLYISYCYDL